MEASDWAPRRRRRADGEPRRVGVEIEFGDLDVENAAHVVASTFGGDARGTTDYEWKVGNSAFGDFVVEVDFALLKQMGTERVDSGAEPSWWSRLPEDLLAAWSGFAVPVEIAAPPVGFERLAELEKLVAALRQAGARGTGAEPYYAFGVHFNVEPVSLDIEEVLACARSFLVLEQHLRESIGVDVTRRMLLFLQPWPEPFARRVLDPAYEPTMDAFLDDYLRENASRNRALDLLPLLAHLDAERVRSRMGEPVAARPALHYRLANSRVGEADWRLRDEWQRWLDVERVAEDRVLLADLSRRLRDRLARPSNSLEGWSEEVRECLA